MLARGDGRDGMERTAEAAAREVVRCWADGDGDRYRGLAAPVLRYREATGRGLDGPDGVVSAWGALRAGYPDLDGEVLDVGTRGSTTVLAVVWRAVRSAPRGTEPPDYRRLVVGDVVALQWEGGRLVQEWHRPGLLGLLVPDGSVVPSAVTGAAAAAP
jgi:hypothetical protein